ncbi:MAG: polyphosphate kinase, partial [Planctomycetota bacterium]
SLLEFNRRVLEQAKNKTVPLLERLRFLSICSTNLDEFFEVRAAGLRQQVKYDIARPGADGLSPQETLAQIHRIASRIVREQYRVLNDELLPQLAQEGICVHSRSAWTEEQRRWVKQYFRTEVAPVLTPMGLDPSHPFPRVVNKSLNFFVSLKGKDAFGRDSRLAVVPVPRSLPRLIPFPKELAEGKFGFAMLSSVIHAHIDEIFPGMSVTGCFQFRVTRDSDLWVDEEEIEDLMLALKVELQTRHLGDAVRLEVADNCEEDLARFLLENFDLESRDCYRVNGPVNLHRLVAIYDKVDRPDLKYPSFYPGTPKRVSSYPTMFEALRAGDIVLHHPYESFKPVLELARQAARDPDVLAIR